jgi:hypothetical protein
VEPFGLRLLRHHRRQHAQGNHRQHAAEALLPGRPPAPEWRQAAKAGPAWDAISSVQPSHAVPLYRTGCHSVIRDTFVRNSNRVSGVWNQPRNYSQVLNSSMNILID